MTARTYGKSAGAQGQAWDVALCPPEVSNSDWAAWSEYGPEYARLDGRLSVVSPGEYPLDVWPSAPMPTLEGRGYVTIPRDPGIVTYFRRY